MFVLDTDIVTTALHKNPVVLSRIRQRPENVWISVIAIEEMIGPAIAEVNKARGNKKRDAVQSAYDFLYTLFDALRLLQVLPYTEEAHRIYMSLPESAKAKGKNDCRLASIALSKEWTVITRNVRHFEGIVRVENWMD